MKEAAILIYFMKREKGVLEKYSEYFLKQLRGYYEEVVFVGREKIEGDVQTVILQANTFNALQAYLLVLKTVGLDKIKNLDRIICVSDDLMGPIGGNIELLFNKMQGYDCWSITKQHRTPMNYLDYTGEHLQDEYLHTNFIVFEKALLRSNRLIEFLEHATSEERLRDSWIDPQALCFTKMLLKNNLKIGTFVDTNDIGKIYYNPLLYCPKKLIEEKHCPFFSVESFSGSYVDIISNTVGLAARELLEYLQVKKIYNVDWIWDTILKHDNQQDIYNNLQLNYILDSKKSDREYTANILKEKKIVLIMHLYFADLVELSFHYASSFPKTGDIYITTDTSQKKEIIEKQFQNIGCNKVEVRVIKNRGRDVSALLTGVKDIIQNYDYACFVHDKKSAQLVPGSIGQDFGIQCLENTLCSEEFVNNVICTLYENERLGLLSPIYPIHGSYFAVHGDMDWAGNFDNTVSLARELGIDVSIEPGKAPIAPLGTMFWFKVPALKCLYKHDWQYEDFPEEPNGVDGTLLHAIERLYSYAVQQEGYYPAILSNEIYASVAQTNLAIFLQGINGSLEKYRKYCSFQQAINVIESMIYEINYLKKNNEHLVEKCEDSLQSNKKRIKNFISKWLLR